MAEINLLQSNQPVKKDPQQRARIFRLWSLIGLAVVLLATGTFWYLNSKAADQVASLNGEITAQQDSVMQLQNYSILITDQQKSQDLKVLLNQHLDWSQLLPKLFDATLAAATYNKVQAQADGSASITGTVGSFADLDKLIQGFQLADFHSYIRDVRLVNIGFSSDLNRPGITFTINVTFNPIVIKAQ